MLSSLCLDSDGLDYLRLYRVCRFNDWSTLSGRVLGIGNLLDGDSGSLGSRVGSTYYSSIERVVILVRVVVS